MRDPQTVLTTRFQYALVFAWQVHNGQCRKGTKIPYIAHLLAVSSLVQEHGGGEDEAIAALLHDAVEDRGIELRTICELFGPTVSEIVRECSDSLQKNPLKKRPWKERKLKYIKHLRSASKPAQLVSAADKLHNARAILGDYRELGEKLWDRFNADRDEILWYYGELVKTFKETGNHIRLVRDLEEVVIQLLDAAEKPRRGAK